MNDDQPPPNEDKMFWGNLKAVTLGGYRLLTIVLLGVGGFMAKQVYSTVVGYGDAILGVGEQSRQSIADLREATNTRLNEWEKWRAETNGNRYTREDAYKTLEQANLRFNEHERRLGIVENSVDTIKGATLRTEKILDEYFRGKKAEPKDTN